MALFTQEYLRAKAGERLNYLSEAQFRSLTAKAITSANFSAAAVKEFDIFLSHSFEDAILIKGLRDELVELGYSVYVDWIEDAQLNRERVAKDSAAVLRERMRQCRCLFFVTSDAAKASVWMPWELGYMDSRTGARVAIVPVVKQAVENAAFKGQEYLGLYPYLDKTKSTLFIQDSVAEWVRFNDWLKGENPKRH